MGWLSSWRDYRAFNKLSRSQRRIAFYSETRHDWHHFEPIIAELTDRLDQEVCYVTSDPRDRGLKQENPRVRTFCIEEGLWRTTFFQMLKADVAVVTFLDLDNYDLKRSIYPVHYVYMFHGMGSTHMVDHEDSYDHYDSILCVGPHQMREIRRREELAGLPPKRLIEHGYTRLERLIARKRAWDARASGQDDGEITVLLAPTWGDTSILNVCGAPLIRILLDAGFRVLMRPHYHTRNLTPEVVDGLVDEFGDHPRFEHIELMGETESLFRSDILICDWSAMAVEYAFGLCQPVLFIDVPRRIRNPRYEEWGIEPIEEFIRDQVGRILSPDDLDQAPDAIRKLLEDRDAYAEHLAELREECVFNLGHAAEKAADALAAIARDEAAKDKPMIE